jgi:heme oxygenase
MIAELTARLAELAALNQTTTYGALARDLNLTGPATIARLTDALERLMEQDTAAGAPLRAALVNARGSPLPASGFFAKAAALGHDTTNPAQFVAHQRAALFVR